MTALKRTMTPEQEERWTASANNGSLRGLLLEDGGLFEAEDPPRAKLTPIIRYCLDCPIRVRRGLRCPRCATIHASRQRQLNELRRIAIEQAQERAAALKLGGLPCNLAGCEEEATESGRCVKHEAIWLRLHARS